ncbi:MULTISPECIES: hypothetical protein [Shouchella]|jgi:hypothetical protein|nr:MULTISPECIES: hypothetical protein [Shouchella]MDO7284009.1 hypothetical protein [Shouchella clausii]MDO7304105.1 hypothetical protein [Shouchella clausii]MEB5477984.1 hypothetical protein [Shouchella clausii]MED4159131.1 hypothetical protein [Shouchella clausii]MED4177435.1 hypothetical protein [Shouchella clausii]
MKRIIGVIVIICFVFVPFVDGAKAETSVPVEMQDKPGTAT